MVFIGSILLTTDKAGEDVAAKREIGPGRDQPHRRDYERGPDGRHA